MMILPVTRTLTCQSYDKLKHARTWLRNRTKKSYAGATSLIGRTGHVSRSNNPDFSIAGFHTQCSIGFKAARCSFEDLIAARNSYLSSL